MTPIALDGNLSVPDGARGLVAFIHGLGASRLSASDRLVAEALHAAGLGTLFIDLNSADVETLAGRAAGVIDWLASMPATADLRLGLYATSAGAAAALMAAVERPDAVGAVMARSGRPDLADGALGRVAAPTLLVVGGADRPLVGLNRAAFADLRCHKQLAIVPGAKHDFDAPEATARLALHAQAWFRDLLGLAAPRAERPSA